MNYYIITLCDNNIIMQGASETKEGVLSLLNEIKKMEHNIYGKNTMIYQILSKEEIVRIKGKYNIIIK
jgi:hypothetical protein